ncbi:ABC transporter permease [Nocardioides sp. LHG3406-4]|uniref:ABC transporter permease n=1 Tax=Nocardioides sp. LHG3406-4 TaxID=2804575 RepID=UPI003CF12489
MTTVATREVKARTRVHPSERAITLSIMLGTLGVLIAAWEVLPRTGVLNRTVIPTATDTLRGLGQLFESGYWWEDLRGTLLAVLIAWVLGCAFGLFLGIVMGASPFIRTAITPYTIALQALPKIVLAPLFIGWLGFGAESKIAIAVAICFFPVWIDTMIGLAMPSREEFTLMRSLNASRTQTFVKLQMPTAIPMVMVGIKHAMLLSFTGVLVAEILAASSGGLGTLAKEYSLQLNMPLTMAVVTTVLVIAVSLVSAMDFLEQRVVFWSEQARGRKS